MTSLEFLACSLVMAVASLLHGSVGFGLALVAAPLLLLIDPVLVPAPVIITGGLLVVGMAIRERHAIDMREMWWAVAGCAIGSAGAAFLLLVISEKSFELLFGLILVAAVILSTFRGMTRRSKGLVFGAGALSGLMGTTTSIGGPPLALVYQSATAPELRATMSGYFIAASILAIASLAAASHLGLADIERAAYLTPGMLVGLAASNYTKAWLKPVFVKPAVLILSTSAAVAILFRYFG